MAQTFDFHEVADLTTQGLGIHPDAEALVYANPRIEGPVRGRLWTGTVGKANALVRLPAEEHWNGKLIIGATPAVRTERSLDLLLSDAVIQRGYAFAACDKGTPGLTLRDPSRSISEWPKTYAKLTELAYSMVQVTYGAKPHHTYISGVSNGGYITRKMIEMYPELFDGAVEWEGVFWHPKSRHLLTSLPMFVTEFPIYYNWRGDRTATERRKAHERLVEAGLHPNSEPYWSQYFTIYWLVSLWLYGHSLDPDWAQFALDWSEDWFKSPDLLANYPWESRMDILSRNIEPIANSGIIQKPLLSVAGNWDCLVPFTHHAQAYKEHVASMGWGHNHRLYEIEAGNHVDGLLRTNRGNQQPVQRYYEAALLHLENWVEEGIQPPNSGHFYRLQDFWEGQSLYSQDAH